MRNVIIIIVLALSACSSAKKEPSKEEVCRAASKNQLEIVAETLVEVRSRDTYLRMKTSNPYEAKQLREAVWTYEANRLDLPVDTSARWDRFQTNCEGDKWTKEEVACLLKAKTIDALKVCGAFEGAGNWK